MKTTRRFPCLIALAGWVASATVCLAQFKTNAAPGHVHDRQPAITTNSATIPTNAPALVPVPKALTLAEVTEMAGKGVSEATIVNALRASGAVYILTTKEVNALQQAKVSETIIDYLLATPRRLQERDRLLPVYYPLHWPSLYHDHHSSFYHDYHPSYGHGLNQGVHR